MTHTLLNRRHTHLQLLSVLAVVVVVGTGSAEEPKARSYALAAPPLEVLGRLPALGLGSAPRLSDDEHKLLEKVWAMRVKKPTAAIEDETLLLDAMLFASGIEEAAAREKYRERFTKLADQAKDAVRDAKDPLERGEQLMQFLHGGVMSKSFKDGQTSLAGVFDTGQFNCVSSTALYYLVGSRLGLQLRAIAIPGLPPLPGHASLDLIDGNTRVQVEPTNQDGFDWQTKVKRPGVLVTGFVPDRKTGHEVDAFGVAAMMYSNRGVALVKDNRRLDAIGCYLAALALDPTGVSATNNLMSAFSNWGGNLLKEKKFEDAVRVLAFGRTVAPRSDALRDNLRIAWYEYIETTLAAGKDKEGVALAARAAKAVPDDERFQSASRWFIQHGETRIEADGWEAGLSAAERGLKVLSPAEGKALSAWRTGVFRRWSQEFLDKGDVDGSLKVLARAHALDPADRGVAAGIAYHTQEALPKVEARSGVAAAVIHFEALRKQFPAVAAVAEEGESYADNAVSPLAKGKRFKEALGAFEKYKALLPGAEQQARVGGAVYARWAGELADKKEWKAALEKYAEGLRAFPKHEGLTRNGVATVDDWAEPAFRAKNWDEAIRVYQTGLEYFPGNEHLFRNKTVCEDNKARR
jgi:tetratricopeptide (TPR) repeat protein